MKGWVLFYSRLMITCGTIVLGAVFSFAMLQSALAEDVSGDILKRLEKVEREAGNNSLAKKLGLSLYGYVDLSYVQNFNNPSSQVNALRIFDKDANSFDVRMAQIVLEKQGKSGGSMEDRAGFRVKLDFGEDSQFTGGTDFGDEADFQEVYAQFVAPFGNGLDLRVGRQNTLIGYEVIESPFNPNFSRSWLFGIGEPFTTTGIRLGYQVNDKLAFAIGGISAFTQGQGDVNRGKSLETAVYLTPNDRVGLTGFLFWGPEPSPVTGSGSLDLIQIGGILNLNATDQTSFVVEGYYANQAGANAINPGKNARWNGVAGYLIHDFTDQWGVRIRGEIFEDAGGTRSCLGSTTVSRAASKTNVCFVNGVDPNPPVVGGIAQTLWETTYTLQYKPVPSLITRVEFRYDKSNQSTFQYGTRSANHQETLSGEVIFLF